MLRDAALRAAPQHEGTSELQFGMRSAVLVLRSADAGGVSQTGTGVRASRRMRTAPMPRDAALRAAPRHEGAMGQQIASRSRERGVVQSQGRGFSLFWSCSVLLSAAKSDDPRETGRADFSFASRRLGEMRNAGLWPAALFFSCYLQGNTGAAGPRGSPSHVADAAVHHYLTRCRRGRG